LVVDDEFDNGADGRLELTTVLVVATVPVPVDALVREDGVDREVRVTTPAAPPITMITKIAAATALPIAARRGDKTIVCSHSF